MVTTIIERAFGLFAKEQPSNGKPTGTAKKAIQTNHAVSIETGRNCCHGARMLRGQRFLSREAPTLPLKNCGLDECTCHYAHHEDRRAGPRRARDMGVAIDGWVETDKRGGSFRGRRKVDNKTDKTS